MKKQVAFGVYAKKEQYRREMEDRLKNRPTFERWPSQLWYMIYENCRRFN